jgi:hypothetical protein
MKLFVLFFLFVSSINSFTPLFKSIDNSYRYGSEERKYYKKNMNYSGKVQDHHCIPRQFRNHPLVCEIAFDVDCAKNIKIMPTRMGILNLNLDPRTLTHDLGHSLYNRYVGKQLAVISKEPTLDMKKYQFWLFLSFLKENMQFNTANIPWL